MNQVKFLWLACTFATSVTTVCTTPPQRVFRSWVENQNVPAISEVLHWSCNLIGSYNYTLPHFGNMPKNFDFVHQTVSHREAHMIWAWDYKLPPSVTCDTSWGMSVTTGWVEPGCHVTIKLHWTYIGHSVKLHNVHLLHTSGKDLAATIPQGAVHDV